MSALRCAVLVSGSGTNLQALLDAAGTHRLAGARIAVVLSNRPGVAALDRASAAGVPAEVVDHRTFADRPAFEAALLDRVRSAGADLVVLAGFMRVLGPTFLGPFAGRIVNIHPSLLPAFPGIDAQRQAFAAGVRVTGCTVHFVDDSLDGGPIIAQAAVPVHADDDAESVRRRILAEEHRLLPEVVRWIAEGRVAVDGRRVTVAGAGRTDLTLVAPSLDVRG